jgi:hypothetical protein
MTSLPIYDGAVPPYLSKAFFEKATDLPSPTREDSPGTVGFVWKVADFRVSAFFEPSGSMRCIFVEDPSRKYPYHASRNDSVEEDFLLYLLHGLRAYQRGREGHPCPDPLEDFEDLQDHASEWLWSLYLEGAQKTGAAIQGRVPPQPKDPPRGYDECTARTRARRMLNEAFESDPGSVFFQALARALGAETLFEMARTRKARWSEFANACVNAGVDLSDNSASVREFLRVVSRVAPQV